MERKRVEGGMLREGNVVRAWYGGVKRGKQGENVD